MDFCSWSYLRKEYINVLGTESSEWGKFVTYSHIDGSWCILAVPATSIAGASNDYFDYTYQVELSQTQVKINEPFLAHVHSEGTCRQQLPVTVTGAVISGRIIARLQGRSTEVNLNPNFAIQFDGIPGQVGETFRKDD